MSINISTSVGYGNFGSNSYSSGVFRKNNPDDTKIDLSTGKPETDPITGKKECQTCKNRKYQDGSNDPGVSFKTAQNVSPEKAANAVRSHEAEHVRRESAKAERDGAKVLSQTVQIHTSICPECGRTYVSGGTTTTTTAKSAVIEYKKSAEYNQPDPKGENVDLAA